MYLRTYKGMWLNFPADHKLHLGCTLKNLSCSLLCIASTVNLLADLHTLNLSSNVWTELTLASNGTAPTARAFHGFAWTDGKLYVHGGYGYLGEFHNSWECLDESECHRNQP